MKNPHWPRGILNGRAQHTAVGGWGGAAPPQHTRTRPMRTHICREPKNFHVVPLRQRPAPAGSPLPGTSFHCAPGPTHRQGPMGTEYGLSPHEMGPGAAIPPPPPVRQAQPRPTAQGRHSAGPDRTSQMPMVLSSEHEATILASAEMATLLMASLCALNVCSLSPVKTEHAPQHRGHPPSQAPPTDASRSHCRARPNHESPRHTTPPAPPPAARWYHSTQGCP